MTNYDYSIINQDFNAGVTTLPADSSHVLEILSSFLATAGQTSITCATNPNTLYPLIIFVNRIQLSRSLYSLSTATITLTNALSLNDAVTVVYYA